MGEIGTRSQGGRGYGKGIWMLFIVWWEDGGGVWAKYDVSWSFLQCIWYKRHLKSIFFLFSFFFFLGSNSQHREVPKLGIKLELQLPAYTIAAATPDLSCICDLDCSSRQCQILNPLSRARDWTHILRFITTEPQWKVWSQGDWFLQLHSSFSKLLWLFRDFWVFMPI